MTSNASPTTSTRHADSTTSRDPAMTSLQHRPCLVPPDPFLSTAMSSYAYSPLQPQPHTNEQYRSSPSSPSSSMASLNLPPIRSIDPREHHQQPPSAPSIAHHQLPGPPPIIPQYTQQMPSLSQYYGQPMSVPNGQFMPGSRVQMNITSMPPSMRYAIPPANDANRMISGGRHKKEVKRRTKTGCLTCRKRRIKCDEIHPTCRNCSKSKRECLGYDPVFKSQQGPSSIQPAPDPSPTSASSTTSHPYFPPDFGAGRPESRSQSITTASPDSSLEQLEFPLPSSVGSTLPPLDSLPNPVRSMDASMDTNDAVTSQPDLPIRKAKRLKIEEMIDGQTPPPPSPIGANAFRLDQIESIYNTAFAPGLDKFLETKWFSQHGTSQLMANNVLLTRFSNFLCHIYSSSTTTRNPAAAGQEERLIWDLLCMCRTTFRLPAANSTNEELDSNADPIIASNRLSVFESLITGGDLDSNPLDNSRDTATNTSTNAVIIQQLKDRGVEFWYCVGQFVSTPATDAATSELDRITRQCRSLLDTFENRDVIYSIMVMRHVGDRWADLQHSNSVETSNAKTDWNIAREFLKGQSDGKSTNEIIMRLCGMALRCWMP